MTVKFSIGGTPASESDVIRRMQKSAARVDETQTVFRERAAAARARLDGATASEKLSAMRQALSAVFRARR